MTQDNPSLPPAAVLVRSRVADFDQWRQAFEANEEVRRGAGILGHAVLRDESDGNDVTIYMALSDLERAKAFAASDEVRQLMQEAGVVSVPEFTYMTPVRENVVWDRDLPAFLLSHSVADFDRFLEVYDGAGDFQASNGILGHGVARALDDPTVAIVVHQAESFDTLRAFLDTDELKSKMQEAGINSAPDIRLVTLGWSRLYD
ncbi:MAG TPA: hypothetical protein VF855_00365 [Acidimicrobiales bacterium]